MCPTLNNTWLLAKNMLISSSESETILFNSDNALPGMITFLSSMTSSSSLSFLNASLCESVAVQISSLSCINQFTPVNTGRVSDVRSEEHTSELQSRFDLVCRLLLEINKLTYQC